MRTARATGPGEDRGEGPSRGGRWTLPVIPGWLMRAWTDPGGERRPSARDMAIAVVVTVIAVFASYGEAHPTNPSAYFTGPHHLPHTPTAALLLIGAGGAALAWRQKDPRLVVCLTAAAAVG